MTIGGGGFQSLGVPHAQRRVPEASSDGDSHQFIVEAFAAIAAYLQMRWAQHECVTDTAIERLEEPMRRWVAALRGGRVNYSTGDLLRNIEDELQICLNTARPHYSSSRRALVMSVVERFAPAAMRRKPAMS